MISFANPAKRRPLRVAVLTSARAPGLDTVTATAKEDPAFELALVVSSDSSCDAIDCARRAGVTALVHDIRAWHRARGLRWSDLRHREGYDRDTVHILRTHDIDLVLLLGYLHVLSVPMLDAFEGRIVNVHDSDLAILGADGLPKYRGLRATRDAIRAGECATRSTAHLVTDEVDVGPILARSWRFPVHDLATDARLLGADDMLKAYAFAHREWMMRTSWGALGLEVIRAFARGDVRVYADAALVRGVAGGIELEPPLLDAGAHRAAWMPASANLVQ